MIPSGVHHDYVIVYRPSRSNCQFYDTGEDSDGDGTPDVDPEQEDKLPIHIQCGPGANVWAGFLHEETVIHELGHLFDSKTGNQLFTLTGQAQIRDCDQTTTRYVMGVGAPKDGVPTTNWFRGHAGWGSMSAIGVTSQFQQNPSDNPADRVKEAAADMFLNWIYRYTTSGVIDDADKCNSTTIPIDGWEGFRNLDSTGTVNDTTLPGNVRFIWMQEIMRPIFGIEIEE